MVFSVEDRTSFRFAEARLREVRTIEAETLDPAIIILVANKEDLVRSRIISEEGEFAVAINFSNAEQHQMTSQRSETSLMGSKGLNIS